MIVERKPVVKYIGTGTLKDYTFPFKIISLDQVLVLVYDLATDEIEYSEYGHLLSSGNIASISFDPINGGGKVTLDVNLPANQYIVIKLGMFDLPQPFKFRDQDNFKLRDIENSLDFLANHIQRLYETSRRRFGISDKVAKAYDFGVLPNAVSIDNEIDTPVIAGGIPIFDEDGEKLLLKTIGEIMSDSDAGGLPAGGVEGDIIEVGSGNIAAWISAIFSGYSARYNVNWSSVGVIDTLAKILNIQYQPPGVSLGASSASPTLREKGDPVSGTTLSAAITKNTNNITQVRFYKGASLLYTDVAPAPGGGTIPYVWSGTAFSDNQTFSVQVDDGPGTGNSANVTFPFVYPYYMGAAAPGRTPAQVAALTKVIMTAQSSYLKIFSAANGDVFYFAYPASYSDLTSILDVNNFESLPSWTKTTANITGLDLTAQSYKIYSFNNPVVAGNSQYTFKR